MGFVVTSILGRQRITPARSPTAKRSAESHFSPRCKIRWCCSAQQSSVVRHTLFPSATGALEGAAYEGLPASSSTLFGFLGIANFPSQGAETDFPVAAGSVVSVNAQNVLEEVLFTRHAPVKFSLFALVLTLFLVSGDGFPRSSQHCRRDALVCYFKCFQIPLQTIPQATQASLVLWPGIVVDSGDRAPHTVPNLILKVLCPRRAMDSVAQLLRVPLTISHFPRHLFSSDILCVAGGLVHGREDRQEDNHCLCRSGGQSILPGPVSATVMLHHTNTAQQFSGRRCSFILYATWDTRLLTSGPSRLESPLRLLIRWYRGSTQPALRQQGQSLARQQFASRLNQTLLRVLGISLDLGHPVVDVFNQQCLFIHFIYSASGWQFGAMFHGVETALCGYAL